MIKTNLLVGKKPLDLSSLGGFDLSKLNVKYLIIAIALSYVPDFFIYDMFAERLQAIQAVITTHNQKYASIQKEAKSLDNIQKQVDALEKLEKSLEEKLVVVKQIFKMRSNPMNIMLYIAQNTPEDVWLTDLVIENNSVQIKGESKGYKSIGVFIENLRNSIFFRKDIKLEGNSTQVKEGGERVEVFLVRGVVVSYE
jgi:hypothetical protein